MASCTRKWHWFQYIMSSVLALFFGIMTYVTFIAFTRSSGSTGLDMSTIQQKRYDVYQQTPLTETEMPLTQNEPKS